MALLPWTAPLLEGYCMEINGRLGTFFCSCSGWSQFWLSDRSPADGGDLSSLTASFIITSIRLSTGGLSTWAGSAVFRMVLLTLTHPWVFKVSPRSISPCVLWSEVNLNASPVLPHFPFPCLWSRSPPLPHHCVLGMQEEHGSMPCPPPSHPTYLLRETTDRALSLPAGR